MIDDTTQAEIAEKLMQHIIDKREEIKLTPIKTEATSLAEASELATVNMTGHTMSTLLALQERADKADDLNQKYEKYFTYVILFAMVLGIPVVMKMLLERGA